MRVKDYIQMSYKCPDTEMYLVVPERYFKHYKYNAYVDRVSHDKDEANYIANKIGIADNIPMLVIKLKGGMLQLL